MMDADWLLCVPRPKNKVTYLYLYAVYIKACSHVPFLVHYSVKKMMQHLMDTFGCRPILSVHTVTIDTMLTTRKASCVTARGPVVQQHSLTPFLGDGVPYPVLRGHPILSRGTYPGVPPGQHPGEDFG